MRLGALSASLSIVEPALTEEQPRQGVKDPKPFAMQVVRRRNSKSYLEVFDDLLSLILGVKYVAEDTVTLADRVDLPSVCSLRVERRFGIVED